jgi:lysozyme family protein
MKHTPESIITEIIRREGGYVNHPADRGGPTKFGITLATLRQVNPGAAIEDVQRLTQDDAKRIYLDLYYHGPKFDQIVDDRLRALLVDSGVHSGPTRATRWLQHAVKTQADGIIGPKTLKAVEQYRPDHVRREVYGYRLRHLGEIITNSPSQSVFAKGWMARMAELTVLL